MTKKQRSLNMSSIRSKNSEIEIKLRKALWSRGLRYRIHTKDVFGKPDIVFSRQRIAVFVDSEFWHGFNWTKAKDRIGTNREFWVEKIESNMRRDNLVNDKLSSTGWTVLRFWGNDIKINTERCVELISDCVLGKRITAGSLNEI